MKKELGGKKRGDRTSVINAQRGGELLCKLELEESSQQNTWRYLKIEHLIGAAAPLELFGYMHLYLMPTSSIVSRLARDILPRFDLAYFDGVVLLLSRDTQAFDFIFFLYLICGSNLDFFIAFRSSNRINVRKIEKQPILQPWTVLANFSNIR